MSNQSINFERLRALRVRARLSQKALAHKVGTDVGTISRWERGAITNLRKSTLGKLAEALRATPDILCGVTPLPDEQHDAPQTAEKMNLAIDTRCRNALGLVALRYGVTRQQIVEAAPLIFYFAAEKSLELRRNNLEAYVSSGDAAMAARPAHLAPKWAYDEDVVDEEERSIRARDLFADQVQEIDGSWDEPEDNPFAAYLSSLLREVLTDADQVRFKSSWSPSYEICREEASALVGGDQTATAAILAGSVALHELARALPKATPEERAEWVRANARDELGLDDLLQSLPGKSDTQHHVAKTPVGQKVKP